MLKMEIIHFASNSHFARANTPDRQLTGCGFHGNKPVPGSDTLRAEQATGVSE